MSDLASLYIRVDSSGVVTASKDLDSFTKKSKDAEGATKSMEDKFQKMSLAAKAAYAAIGAAIVTFAKDSIQAFMEAEKAQMKLLVAMKNQGDYSRQAAKDLQDYAAALQKTTQFEDDLIIAQMGTLKSFGMTNEEIKRSISAAADMASMTGQSIESVSDLLGKAYAGQTQMLTRYGIVVDENIPKSKKFEEVLKQLEQRFGGAAQAQLQTYSGQWMYYKNVMSDVAETIGHGLLKALEGLAVMAGLVTSSFLIMGEKILAIIDWLTTPLKALLNMVAWVAEKLGAGGIADGMRAIADATGMARQSINATKNDVLGWTNKQYELLKATEKTYDVVEKMGKAGKRTTYNLDGKTTKAAGGSSEKSSLLEETFDYDKYRDNIEKLRQLHADFNIELADGTNAAMMKIQESHERTYVGLEKMLDEGVIPTFEEFQDLLEKLEAVTGKKIKDLFNKDLPDATEKLQKNINDIANAFGDLGSACSEMAGIYEEGSSSAKRWTEAAKAMEIAQRSLAVVNAVVAVAAQASAPFPAGFVAMAGMLASMISLLASIGESIGGGGGSAPSVSKTSSTVLGSDEQSQSVSKSYEMMQESYDMQYTKLTAINDQLRDLNSNITGLVTSIVRTGGITAGMNVNTGTTSSYWANAGNYHISQGLGPLSAIGNFLNAPAAGVIKFLGEGLFGGETTTKIKEQGLSIGSSSLADILSGGISAEQYAKIKTTTSRGWGMSDSVKTSYQYSALDSEVQTMLNLVFQNLGSNLVSLSEQFGIDTQNALDYTFNATKINLKNMTSDEMNKVLNEFISSTADIAAGQIFGTLISQYQKLNEGLFETANRLIRDKEVIAELMEMTGSEFEGTTEAAIAFSETLIDIAGGLDELTDAFNTYYEAFFTDQEKQLNTQRQLQETLSSFNVTLPETRDGYRALVESMVGVNDEAYVSLLKAAGAADDYYKYIEEAAETTKQAAEDAAKAALDARKSLLNGELDAQRQAYQDRYNEQLKALNSQLDVLSGYVDKLRSARESMKLDDIQSQGVRFGSAKSGLYSLLDQVRGGNFSGLANADDMLKTVTALSPSMYSTRNDYLKDYHKIYNAIAEMEGITGNAKSAAERQIDIMQKTYDMQMEAFDAQKKAIDNLTICTKKTNEKLDSTLSYFSRWESYGIPQRT